MITPEKKEQSYGELSSLLIQEWDRESVDSLFVRGVCMIIIIQIHFLKPFS